MPWVSEKALGTFVRLYRRRSIELPLPSSSPCITPVTTGVASCTSSHGVASSVRFNDALHDADCLKYKRPRLSTSRRELAYARSELASPGFGLGLPLRYSAAHAAARAEEDHIPTRRRNFLAWLPLEAIFTPSAYAISGLLGLPVRRGNALDDDDVGSTST